MPDLQSGELRIKLQLKAHSLKSLELCMVFTNLYHNPLTYCLNLYASLT